MEQPGVAGLGGEAGEARGDLGVEHVRDVGLPLAAQDRDVLAAGVQHDLDRGVGEHGGERRGVEALERVEHDDLAPDADLHEAQQRPVAALGHELGVDPEPALALRPLREPLDVAHLPGWGNWERMTASHAAVGQQGALGRSAACADGVTV